MPDKKQKKTDTDGEDASSSQDLKAQKPGLLSKLLCGCCSKKKRKNE